MEQSYIKQKVLKAQMVLRDVSTENFADALGWSITTAYRKINGLSAFTAPEIQKCVELLSLDSETANEIFFTQPLS